MSDNPFAEPEDHNQTIIRPNPGRRRVSSVAASEGTNDLAAPRRQAPVAAVEMAEGTENVRIGDDVLTAAAGPLLQFMARLRNTANPPDSGEAKPVVVPAAPPPPPEPSALDKLRQFLKPEIDQKLVEVLGTPAQPLVRITGSGMFASDSATVSASFKPLLDRIGLALKEEQGPVKVIGYTDNEPIRTVAFPSNFQLSAARAQAASKIIAATVGDPARLSTEGRAEADPIDTNATPQGRERNRRIEIVLNRQGT